MEEYKQTTKTGTHKSLKGYKNLYLKYQYQKKIKYLYIIIIMLQIVYDYN